MKQTETPTVPMFKTVKQMATICGIGQEALRRMINQNEIDHILIGNRRLLTEKAVWDWYERNKVSVTEIAEKPQRIVKVTPRRAG